MRTNATQFLGIKSAMEELDSLKFAVHSMAEKFAEPGSYDRENARNCAKGISARIDYLHDSFSKILRIPS